MNYAGHHVLSASVPTTTTSPLAVGFLWSDTATNLIKICTSLTPVTFAASGGGAVNDSDVVFSDITTGDVTSAKHGFAPKSSADATKFLNAAATPAYAQVKDADLATTDVTTNDVTTAKHGFAPKAGTDQTVLKRSGSTVSFDKVVEADITLAANTTNDVSTSKHGFAPVLPNDATKFLDGTGTYSVPASGGGYDYVQMQSFG